jgi:hypothetical protein
MSEVIDGLSEKDKRRLANIHNRSEKLGVLDINFSGAESADTLKCYERTLDIIEKNKRRFDQNAGE